MIETVLAALCLLVCVALLIRMALSARHQQRLDAAARRVAWACRRAALRAWALCKQLWRGPSARRQASQAAEEAIRRARGEVERDGNVYKPKSFDRPDKLH